MCAPWASNGYSFRLVLVKPMKSNFSWPDFFILFSLERPEPLSVSCKLFKLPFVSVLCPQMFVHQWNTPWQDYLQTALPQLWINSSLLDWEHDFLLFSATLQVAQKWQMYTKFSCWKKKLCARKTITTTTTIATVTARQGLRIAKCSPNIQKY
jgi:hypothetical protein